MIRANFEILGKEFNIECDESDYGSEVKKEVERAFKFEDYIEFMENHDVENFKLYWNDYETGVEFEQSFTFAEDLEILYIENIKDMAQYIDIYKVIGTDYYVFDKEKFFDKVFDKKYDAVRAVYFGKVNWNDIYIYFNDDGNLETCDKIPYEDYASEIINEFIEKKYKGK